MPEFKVVFIIEAMTERKIRHDILYNWGDVNDLNQQDNTTWH